MKSRLERAVVRYGRQVMLHTESGEYGIKAFLNPFRSRNKFQAELEGTRIGRMEKGQLSFIACAEGAALLLREGDVVSAGTQRYLVQRCETQHLGEEPFYIWAVLLRVERGAVR